MVRFPEHQSDDIPFKMGIANFAEGEDIAAKKATAILKYKNWKRFRRACVKKLESGSIFAGFILIALIYESSQL